MELKIFNSTAVAERIKAFIISKDPELMEPYVMPKPKKPKTKLEEMKNPYSIMFEH